MSAMYQVIGNERRLIYKDKDNHITFKQKFFSDSKKLEDDDQILYVDDPKMQFLIFSKSGRQMGVLYLQVDEDIAAEVTVMLPKKFFHDSIAKKRIHEAFNNMKEAYAICDSVEDYVEEEMS